jgi:PAS domain-containing protein
MSREKTDMTTAAAEDARATFPYSVLRSRWLLVVALAALVVFGGQAAPTVAQYALLAAMLASNLLLSYVRTRGIYLAQALEVVLVVDVLVITLIIGSVDPTPETYLIVFAALVLAVALARVSVIMLLMSLVCAAYAIYMYTEVGPDFWRNVQLILRLPFLFALGLHFASIASCLRREKSQHANLMATAKQHVERAEHLSKEQDRLRALSNIGRLALTSAEAPPVRVLLEMTHRVQKSLNATRCSLILLRPDGPETGWKGRSKDRNVEVRTLPPDIGPEELQGLLLNGKITELHPGESKELMAKVKRFFPDSNPFGSLLISPIEEGETMVGALILIDSDNARKYSGGERDFFWTASLMAGAFIEARRQRENEVRLRTLITNAPVIMFATGTDGTIKLFEGRGSEALGGRPIDRVGKSLFAVADDPEVIRKAFEVALGGRLFAGTLSLDGTVFETQYSPLRSLDGEISGVMGVTTAILVQSGDSAAAPTVVPAPTDAPAASPPTAASYPQPANPPREQTAKTHFPVPRPDLKPKIPLADEKPEDIPS